jgi:capsular exopolysaccharide synthesis family protein
VLTADPDISEDDAVDLRVYLAVLGRRWKVVLAVTALTVLASLALSFSQATKYRAVSELLIRPQTSDQLLANSPSGNVSETARQLNNEVRLFESESVEAAVDKAYDGPLDPRGVQAAVVSDTSDIVRATLTATNAKETADLLNLYVKTFVDVRRGQQVDELLSVGTEIQSKVDDLTAQIGEIRAPLDAVEKRLESDPGSASLAEQRTSLTQSLSPQLTPLESQRGFYQSQLEQLDLRAQITSSGSAQVIRQARVPQNPVSPSPRRDGAVALVLGAVLGIGLAFLIDTLDERIRGAADLERISGGLPTLALIPEVTRGHDELYVAARDDARSPAAEAYRSLRTALKFAAIDHPFKVVQLTSATSGEGKTTAVANLATAIAQGGDRVAIVCCDLRRPKVQERMKVNLRPGFTDVILGDVTLDAAVQRTASNVFVVAAGSPPPNPSELLSSEKAAAIIKALAEKVDVVILDCTPVLPVTDALVVSRLADATVVVADARSTERKALRRTLQLLHQVGAPVVGIVLNGLPEGSEYGYGYGYRYVSESHQPPTNGTGSGSGKAPDPTRRGVRRIFSSS